MDVLIEGISAAALAIGAITRVKYVWQGNKIRRRESSGDVSRKFLILTLFASAVLLTYNSLIFSVVNIVFWAVEIGVVIYAFACCYRYYPLPRRGMWYFVIDSFRTGWRDTVFTNDKGKVVYAFVVCDLYHIGHDKFLEQAKGLGDWLIVGVLTDDAVKAYKRGPVIPFEERLEIVRGRKVVDRVMAQDSLDPTENLRSLGKVDIVVHGDDWGEDFPGSAYMRSIGKKAVRVPYYPYQSTTAIIEKIRGGDSSD